MKNRVIQNNIICYRYERFGYEKIKSFKTKEKLNNLNMSEEFQEQMVKKYY